MTYDSNSLEWLFRVFGRMHHNCLKSELDKRGMNKVSHPVLLFTLRYEMENMMASQRELAEAIGISAPTVAISIKRMEKAGIVRKVSDAKDLRRNLITLTEKGLQFMDECENALEKIDKSVLTGFTVAEAEQLKMFYIRMIGNLESIGAQLPAQLKRSVEK